MSQLASSVEIYWISGSPFAWRVLLTAEVKGIHYEEKLQASKGELKAPDFLAINPLGRVPALREGANAVRLSFMRCLQPRHFLRTHATPDPLVADEPAGKTHQDRREGLSHGRYVAFHWA
jgi:hypothetical protein